MYKAGQTFITQFITQNISGVPVNTDNVPAGSIVRNGLDDFSVSVYCRNIDIGRYMVSGLIPITYNQYDSIGVIISGYVNSNLGKMYIDFGSLDASDWTIAERNQLRYKVGIDGTSTKPASGISHIELSSSGLDNIQIENGINARQSIVLNTAVLCGVSSGVGNVVWFDGINSSNARVSSIANSGIRTTVNLVLP